MAGDHHNIKMERLNGEICDREKTIRGIKKTDTAILKGINSITTTLEIMKDWQGKHQQKWLVSE
jgi:hypothetical protein